MTRDSGIWQDVAGCSRYTVYSAAYVIRRICKAVESTTIQSLRKFRIKFRIKHFDFVTTLYIFVHLGALCFMMFIYFILPSCDEADYFYVVQSGSFQVSKTEAAASAEKILGWDARDARDAPAEDFKHVQPMV